MTPEEAFEKWWEQIYYSWAIVDSAQAAWLEAWKQAQKEAYEDAIKEANETIVTDNQRAISWHEVQYYLDIIRQRIKELDK